MRSFSVNPLLDASSRSPLPRFQSIAPEHVTPAVDQLLADLNRGFTKLESSLKSSSSLKYDDVLPSLERLRDPLSFAWGAASHLNGVKNSDDLRKHYQQSQPKVVKALTELEQSRVVYDSIKSLLRVTDPDREPSKVRALELSLKGMTLSGVGLEGAAKHRFNEIKVRLADLSTNFTNNVLDATKSFSLTLTDASLVASCPSSARALWASSHSPSSPDPSSGPFKLTLDGPAYVAALQHLPDRRTREILYRAYVSRASDVGSSSSSSSSLDNVPLLSEILELRSELAALLEFPDFVSLSLATKMAPDFSSVEKMADFMRERALPAAKRELDEITDFAIKNGFKPEPNAAGRVLQPWDVPFWSERLKESKFDVTDEEYRPYFALDRVLVGLFGLSKHLFGVEIRPGKAETWHSDVRFYDVFDVEAPGRHIASFYLDPFSRPLDKRGGAWMDVCVGRSAALKRDVPVAYLVCNGSPPAGGKPSLMTFREVETLFHEFGHGLQHMLTNEVVGDIAGINGVEWDAVEVPSQFMENWCYDKKTVDSFAKHYETGETLPVELYDKLIQQRTFGSGLAMARQLTLGQIDMELHRARKEKGALTKEMIFEVQRRVSAKYAPHLPPIEDDRFLCSFSHIFGGGYAAGYYSYKWAEVMSADAFGRFEEVGLSDAKATAAVGRDFRKTILGMGGGVHPSEVFRAFRGRDPTPEALLRHNGLNA